MADPNKLQSSGVGATSPQTIAGSAPVVDPSNFIAASQEMKLTPQEQYLYQTHLANLAKGGVPNPTGGTSTLYQMSVEHDGKTYNVPTVWNGKILSTDKAMEQVRKVGIDKFPSYDTRQEAQARYDQMHSYMEKDLPNGK